MEMALGAAEAGLHGHGTPTLKHTLYNNRNNIAEILWECRSEGLFSQKS